MHVIGINWQYLRMYVGYYNIFVTKKVNIWKLSSSFYILCIKSGGGGQGGKHLPPPVPPLLPPVPFCELSPASCLFSANLTMLLLLSRPI